MKNNWSKHFFFFWNVLSITVTLLKKTLKKEVLVNIVISEGLVQLVSVYHRHTSELVTPACWSSLTLHYQAATT